MGTKNFDRLTLERPDAVTAIISQNGNAYVEGFGASFWAPIEKYWNDPSPANRDALRMALTFDTTKWQYVNGALDPSKLDPATWHLDVALLQRPGCDNIKLDLFYDFRTNVPLYPAFQEYFRKKQPPALIIWGENDPIFIPPGAEAFTKDLPNAIVKFVDAGHFAL